MRYRDYSNANCQSTFWNFSCLRHYPDPKDHQDLYLRGVWMNPDINNYDVEHPCRAHPLMSASEWRSIYDRAWHLYYSPEHIETLFKRTVACGASAARLAAMIFDFYGSHPSNACTHYKAGCSELPIENPISFFLRRTGEIENTYLPASRFRTKLERMRRRIMNDPGTATYTDVALSSVDDDLETDKLELFRNPDAARQAAERVRMKAAPARAQESRSVEL